MTCVQPQKKTPTSISEIFCYVKLGFQILYVVELFSSLFFKHKLKARGTHTPTHDAPSLSMF